MRQLLIGAQAAIVMIVLSGAALLVRSAINLQQEPLGFDTNGVLTARIALPAAQYGSPEASRAAYRQVLERVAASPGVRFAALDSQAPLVNRGGSNGLLPEGRENGGDRIQSDSHFVTPDYFKVLQHPAEGRADVHGRRHSAGAARDGDQRNAGARRLRRCRSDRQTDDLLRGLA